MLIWFIDDDTEEYKKLKNIIYRGIDEVSSNDIFIQNIHPSKLENDSDIDSIRKNPDIILVDFQLITPEKSKGKNHLIGNFNGLDIAASLRIQHPSIPIFLYSYSGLAKLKPIQEDIADAVFDEILYKDNFLDFSQSLLDYLKIIISGYSAIIKSRICENDEKENRKEILHKLLSAPSNSYDDIDSILAELDVDDSVECSFFDISSLIRKKLMRNPGILYDTLHAATFLGISEKAFKSISDFFKSAEYQGIFSDENQYWWKSELKDLADNIMEGNELRIPHSHGFHTAWKRKYGTQLDLAQCYVSGNTPAECVCCILNKPAMIRYTFQYPDIEYRLPVFDEKRVCFKAIFENKFNKLALDKDSLKIFENFVQEIKDNVKK
jgi:hypothetical protein